jgi:hypothetical protein
MSDPEMVPHELPDSQELKTLIADLPLWVASHVDEPEIFMTVLQKAFKLDGEPLYLQVGVIRLLSRHLCLQTRHVVFRYLISTFMLHAARARLMSLLPPPMRRST